MNCFLKELFPDFVIYTEFTSFDDAGCFESHKGVSPLLSSLYE